MRSIESRLESLENSSRRWRALTILLGFTLILLAAKPNDPEVLRAGRFEVVNEAGVPVITLAVSKDGGSVSCTDAQGHPCVKLGIGPDGGIVAALPRDPKSKAGAYVAAATDGGSVSIDDAGQREKANMTVMGTTATIEVHGPRGACAGVGSVAETLQRVYVKNEAGDPVWLAPAR